MCVGPLAPKMPTPPAPVAAPAPEGDGTSVTQKDAKRRLAAAGRSQNILTGSRGTLGDPNVGKTLLGA